VAAVPIASQTKLKKKLYRGAKEVLVRAFKSNEIVCEEFSELYGATEILQKLEAGIGNNFM
jgi:hypothetical protein